MQLVMVEHCISLDVMLPCIIARSLTTQLVIWEELHVYIFQSNLTIIDSKINHNKANLGAILYSAPECRILITRTLITYNTASQGMVLVVESQLDLTDVTISHNNGSLYAFYDTERL